MFDIRQATWLRPTWPFDCTGASSPTSNSAMSCAWSGSAERKTARTFPVSDDIMVSWVWKPKTSVYQRCERSAFRTKMLTWSMDTGR